MPPSEALSDTVPPRSFSNNAHNKYMKFRPSEITAMPSSESSDDPHNKYMRFLHPNDEHDQHMRFLP